MRNNFISNLSFHKKPLAFPPTHQQSLTSNSPPHHSALTAKNANDTFQRRVNKSDRTTTKPSERATPNESELSSSFREQDICKLKQKFQKLQPARTFSPIKSQGSSPCSSKAHTIGLQGKVKTGELLPIRSTLKNNTPSKSPPTDSSITKEASYNYRRQERYSGLYQLKIQNQKLLQENAFLKRELGEIKKNILFGCAVKKEENNVRDTLKKQNSENFELRIKLELVTKRSIALEGLVESKDEEIQFLKNKLSRTEEELKSVRAEKGSELTVLQQRIASVLKGYQDLEIRISRDEQEQRGYRQKWDEEKRVYIDRISILQGYIWKNS